ncbi:MAG: hypothetical protein QOF77_714 [Solirubrobacteraceae bacterium]|jgi:hypothetical protein|nr:hypothetical protein [Solirubrobacteraceae bacterium]
MGRFKTEGMSLAQLAAVAIGLAYAVGGVVGFAVTGFDGFTSSGGGRTLFGLTLNPFQSLFHLVVGLGLLWAATRDTSVTEGVLLGVGGVYVVATITGFIYAHIPVITITTAGNPDNYLHLVTGATAVVAALLSSAATGRKRRAAY